MRIVKIHYTRLSLFTIHMYTTLFCDNFIILYWHIYMHTIYTCKPIISHTHIHTHHNTCTCCHYANECITSHCTPNVILLLVFILHLHTHIIHRVIALIHIKPSHLYTSHNYFHTFRHTITFTYYLVTLHLHISLHVHKHLTLV